VKLLSYKEEMIMTEFNGFLPETVAFFNSLEKNNTRQWFEKHKQDYEIYVKNPSIDFVTAMGEVLTQIAPGIHAIPKVNQSLFRINKDTRFSTDKRPYKTNLGILFWEGRGKRMECPGFYFHVEKDQLMLGVGMHCFPKSFFGPYREAVVDKKPGATLQKAVRKVSGLGYTIGEKKYKRVPSGYDPDHVNSEYLKFGGLTAMWMGKIPDAFFSDEIIDFSFAHFKKMAPIHEWLRENLG
jgi:uncharacterized protein (TIGR02453 family)